MIMHGAPACDEITVDVRGRKQSVAIAGSGQPILLLHGYPLDKRLWSRVIPELAKIHLCIAPNMRGFGDSQEERFSFSIADLADDSARLMSQLQVRQPFTVCGLSMGGYVAMEMVRRHRARISCVLLTNTRANGDDAVAAATRRSIATEAIRQGSRHAAEPMLNKLLHPSAQQSQPELVTLLESMMFGTHASTIAWSQLAMSQRTDFRKEMLAWDVPTMILAGTDDPICPRSVAEEMHLAIPGSKLSWIEGTAHLSPLEAPERWIAAIRD
jgi:3-oxoadipate enol-lactonase